MNLVETTIGESLVHLRFADDPNQSLFWIDIQVPLSELKSPNEQDQPLTNLDMQYLAEVRLAALQYARAIIGAETQRLSALVGRRR
jgi:hypothetical protein